MLVTLKHLLVQIGLLMLSLAMAMPAGMIMRGNPILQTTLILTLFCLIMFILSWPVYKAFSLRPLILPMCQTCGKRHRNYHICRGDGSVGYILCVYCRKPLRLVMTNRVVEKTPLHIATAKICWPEFIGIWKYEAEHAGPIVEKNT